MSNILKISIVAIGIIGLSYFGFYSYIRHDDVHTVITQNHIKQSDVRFHEIKFDAKTRHCLIEDKSPNGDTLKIIIPNAMPTYQQVWGEPQGKIIECETRNIH